MYWYQSSRTMDTSIESILCEELLVEILGKVKNPRERASGSLVCKRWLRSLRGLQTSLRFSIPTDLVSINDATPPSSSDSSSVQENKSEKSWCELKCFNKIWFSHQAFDLLNEKGFGNLFCLAYFFLKYFSTNQQKLNKSHISWIITKTKKGSKTHITNQDHEPYILWV